MVRCKIKFVIYMAVLFLYAGGVPAHAGSQQERRDYLARDIKRMIADLSCDDDSQCRAVGYGYRPCGGFDEFLVYSGKNLDERVLWEAAGEYFWLDHQLSKAMFGACVIPQVPNVSCVEHVCVKQDD